MATQGGTVSEEDILTIVNGSPEDCIGVMNNFILHVSHIIHYLFR